MMTHRWPTNTWKDAQHHSLLEKCKSKLQRDITSHQSEWPSSKSLQTITAGEGMEKRELSYMCGGNVNWYSHYQFTLRKTVWRFLKKLKIELPYDPAIPLLAIYPEKTTIQKNTCTPMFKAALFTIARTWKQPTCLNRGMDKEDVVHIYNGILLSHKKKWNWVICRDVDGPRECHTE